MHKLAQIPYDFYDFLNYNMVDKVEEVLEAMVKEGSAELPSLENLDEYNDNDFALILLDDEGNKLRKLAHVTPELIKVNAAIFEKVSKYLPGELVKVAGTNLKQAAEDWGIKLGSFYDQNVDGYIPNEVNVSNLSLITAHNSPFKNSNNPNNILTKEAKAHIKSPFGRQEALGYFYKNASVMSESERMVFANELKNNMSDTEKDPLIEKLAHKDINTYNEHVDASLTTRLEWVETNPEHQALYAGLWEKRASYKPLEFVGMVDAADRKTDMAQHWGVSVSYPEEAVLAPLTKEASLQHIKMIDQSVLEQYVGNEVAAELNGPDGQAVWESLPTPVKDELMELI